MNTREPDLPGLPAALPQPDYTEPKRINRESLERAGQMAMPGMSAKVDRFDPGPHPFNRAHACIRATSYMTDAQKLEHSKHCWVCTNDR